MADASSRLTLLAPSYALPILRSAGTSTGSSFSPPRTRSSVAASAALTRSRSFERLLDTVARDDDHAVAIADHDIAGRDRHAAADDRQADGAGTAPLRRIRRDAHGEGRDANGFKVIEIAHEAIGDKARNAAIAGDIHQEISSDRRSDIASGRHDQHVAGPGFGERRHERQIVERAAVAGERHADEWAADEPLDAPVESARSVHGVDDEAGRRPAETLDELAWGPFLRRGEDERERFLDHGGPCQSNCLRFGGPTGPRWRRPIEMHVRCARATRLRRRWRACSPRSIGAFSYLTPEQGSST